jgi:hypothetical protein
LLIETFRKTKLWPPGLVPWWPFLYVRVSKNFAFRSICKTEINVGGIIVILLTHLSLITSPLIQFLNIRVSKNFSSAKHLPLDQSERLCEKIARCFSSVELRGGYVLITQGL